MKKSRFTDSQIIGVFKQAEVSKSSWHEQHPGVCADFTVSQPCYRYTPKLSDENERIANLLVWLTHHQRN